ncbi:adenosylcobinamide-GDP ribazoletransferase [Paenibacillus shirakamiensis]|uniref:Adenosylcobinamide-GDP ribazoletransferase n=1 Tax=Paenibacillus shirakamiensis TaxID=1265935 RepID=A0ABS4JFN2_9BACL|nr:adenosylcobinamide-GDP ribazoletransferase [Paenibacillus shirakamiensis]MBP2000526.1 adenosylcobinamide-GDP ribazoletransferase [Paenibacillus shirakamiensis]
MMKRGDPLRAAFQFLSRFPVHAELDYNADLQQKSTRYYPVVGACIGIVLCVIALLASWSLPTMPASVIILIAWIYITGGLHLDGWMDTADGLLSYRSRERMLEIMKDSRVGAMGVIACVLLLLFKFTLIASLMGTTILGPALILAPVWSRGFMVYAIRKWPRARKGEGLAAQFNGLPLAEVWYTTIYSILVSFSGLILLSVFGCSGTFSLITFVLPLILTPLVAYSVGSWAADYMHRRLGGLTGDNYGALNEGLEVVILMVLLIIHGITN